MFTSDFNKPVLMLRRLDAIAASYGCPTLAEQLASDRERASDDLVLGTIWDCTFTRVLEAIARAASVAIDDVDDESFCYIEAEKNPIHYNDDTRFAFAFAKGYVVLTRATRAFDIRCDCIGDDTRALDLIVLSCAMKASQRDRLMLVRYNDIAMMANRAFASGSYAENSTGRPPSDMWEVFGGMLREMRSVVMDIVDKTIVSLPFYKFRNLGECEGYSLDRVAAAIADAERFEITDKMDGSFCQMRWMGEDCDLFGASHRLTSLSGSLNPEVNEQLAFVCDWVEKLEGDGMRYTDLCRDNGEWTFIFEFVRPDLDAHIVQYDESRWGIYLLSARNVETGETMFYDRISKLAADYGLPVTKCFDELDLDGVLDICKNDSVDDREGFVLNIDGWYVKVKLDEFCDISKLVHGAENFNVIIRNVARGSFDDLLGKIPLPYHEKIIEEAKPLFAFNDDMRAYVEAMVAKAPADNPKSAAAYFAKNAPKEFSAICMDAYKRGTDGLVFLYRNPRHPNPSCWRENEFGPRREILHAAMQEIGIA